MSITDYFAKNTYPETNTSMEPGSTATTSTAAAITHVDRSTLLVQSSRVGTKCPRGSRSDNPPECVGTKSQAGVPNPDGMTHPALVALVFPATTSGRGLVITEARPDFFSYILVQPVRHRYRGSRVHGFWHRPLYLAWLFGFPDSVMMN